MKQLNVLLGFCRKKKPSDKVSDDGEEDSCWESEERLLMPNEVAVADDTNAYQFFGDRIFCAPQEYILEGKPSSCVSPSCVSYL
jgi:hypothetical protein